MVRALKKNEAVWYAPDQSYRNKGAAMVNFFGIPAASNPATSRLARISGAAVMTYFGERLPGNARLPRGDRTGVREFSRRRSGSTMSNATIDLLEAQVRRVPEQYLWVHRRFKGLSTRLSGLLRPRFAQARRRAGSRVARSGTPMRPDATHGHARRRARARGTDRAFRAWFELGGLPALAD